MVLYSRNWWFNRFARSRYNRDKTYSSLLKLPTICPYGTFKVVDVLLNSITKVQVSNLRGEAANWKQQKLINSTKADYTMTKHKKTCRFNTNRLVIENGLSNFYQSPNPFLNVISIILSKPVYTLAGVLFISPTFERFKK
jgi:hypothetical protein